MKEIKELDKFITESKKKASKKNKGGRRKFGNKHYKAPETLLKNKMIKRMDKEEYREEWFNGFESFAEMLKKFYNGKDKGIKMDQDDLIDGFSNKKVVKAFISVCEEYLDAGQEIPEVYGFMISEFYLSGEDTEIADNEKEFKKLLEIFKSMNEDKIEDLRKQLKKAGCGKKEAKLAALQFALLSADFRGYKKGTGRVIKFFRELYKSFNEGETIKHKTVKAIMYSCYGKKMSYISSTLLLDKSHSANLLKTAEEKEVYSIVTNIVLDHIKKLDTDDMKEILKRYARSRENNVNQKRRVNLYSGLSDDYSKITKVINRLIRNGMKKELFE